MVPDLPEYCEPAPIQCPPDRCQICKSRIIDEEPITATYRGPIEGLRECRVSMHSACVEELRRKSAARAHDLKAFATGRVAHVLARLPTQATVPLDSAEFADRVKSRRLAVAAARYRIKRGSLAITGPAGCGKTVTAACIVERLCAEAVASYITSAGRDSSQIDRAARIVWTTAAALCIARKQYPLGQGEAPEYERASTAPLLVLDEIGQEIADDRWLLELLNLRVAAFLPTITTSGLVRVEIEKRYGAGTMRRLVEPHGQSIDVFPPAAK